MKSQKIKFRASGVGALMVGQKGLTGTQIDRLKYLQDREAGHKAGSIEPGKGKKWAKLTKNMEEEMAELIAKRDAPFELSKTAKSFITAKWMFDKYRFKKIVVTPQMQKGHLCEQRAMKLLDSVIPASELRYKNPKRYSNDNYTGHPDILLFDDGIGEDTKCPWDLSTFQKVETPVLLYETQVRVYMELTKLERFRVAYCLVSTPNVLIENELRRMFWNYNVSPVHGILDEDDELILEPYEGDVPNELLENLKQIKRNHIYDHIPEDLRIKKFDFEHDQKFIDELDYRVELARKFYSEITLKQAIETVEL